MVLKVVGIQSVISKKNGKTYTSFHCVDTQPLQNGEGHGCIRLGAMSDFPVDSVKIGETYNFSTIYNQEFHSWSTNGLLR